MPIRKISNQKDKGKNKKALVAFFDEVAKK
jgi:hypothetical protein